jgi:hypothetical protein
MIFNFLKGHRISNLIFVPILGIVFWVQAFLKPESKLFAFDNVTMPLYDLLLKVIGDSQFLSNTVAFLLVMLILYLSTRLNKKFMIVETRSYMIAFFLLIMVSSFLPLLRLHPGLPATVFLLFALEKVFHSYHSERLTTNFFDAAFYISIGSLFYFSLVYYMLLIWIAIIILRPFNFREFIMVPVGIVLPYLFAWAYYFFMDDQTLFFDQLELNFKLINYISYLNISNYLFYSFIILLTILASFHTLRQIGSRKIGPRKFLRIMFWFFLAGLVLLLFVPSASLEILPILGIPLAVLFSHYFDRIRSHLMANVLITVLILLMIGVYIYPTLIIWLA